MRLGPEIHHLLKMAVVDVSIDAKETLEDDLDIINKLGREGSA